MSLYCALILSTIKYISTQIVVASSGNFHSLIGQGGYIRTYACTNCAMGTRRALIAVRRRWRTLVVVALCACALAVRVPAHLSVAERFPAYAPARLAHALADFSNQPHITSWWVEDDRSNYTTWRYTVSYTCGTRCSGRAAVLAHDEPHDAAPRHGSAARLHRVTLALRSCTALPLLRVPWTHFCDELGITAVVVGTADGGAQLHEEWSTRCSAIAWLSGACARHLRSQQNLHVARLRAMQDAPSAY